MPGTQSAWEKLGLLDCFALVTGAAIGFYQAALTNQPGTSVLPKTALMLAAFLNALRLAGMYSGPLVLGGQFVFRKRRQCLCAGEWLWLAPLVMVGLVKILYSVFSEIRSVHIEPLSTYYMEVGAAVELSLVALFVLCAISFRVIKWKLAFRWTDGFGCAVCLLILQR
jgi:hypothetical protein